MTQEIIARIKHWEKEANNPLNNEKVRNGFMEKIKAVCCVAEECLKEPKQIILHLRGGLVHLIKNETTAKILLRDFDIDTTDFEENPNFDNPLKENNPGDFCVESYL